MADRKRILMLALNKKVEALRMTSGLTLLDHPIQVLIWGKLPESPEVAEQMEALEFSEVPMTELDPVDVVATYATVAAQIMNSDVAYFV